MNIDGDESCGGAMTKELERDNSAGAGNADAEALDFGADADRSAAAADDDDGKWSPGFRTGAATEERGPNAE